MAVKAPSNVKNPVATTRGWLNGKGELVKAQKLTQEQCDEFNGVATTPVVEAEAPVVEEAPKPKAKRKPRKKKAEPKKEGFLASAISKIKGE